MSGSKDLVIEGARVHNLRNINLRIPNNALVVFTGLSGSGKSSLAFDTIFAEGQRRYLESFSAYARQFIGKMEKPDVDSIIGLSPVIAIEQKTTNKNPRSTVGTITEIYDYLRLLFARASDAYSMHSEKKLNSYTDEEIMDMIRENYSQKSIQILVPLVVGRTGHYRELFESLRKKGYLKVYIDGVLHDLEAGMQTDRYKIHEIDLLVDHLEVTEKKHKRLHASLSTALEMEAVVKILEVSTKKTRLYSRNLMCEESGIAYAIPEPNSFSFNSPYGACPKCNGLGNVLEIDMNKIIPDNSLSIRKGGLAPLGKYKQSWIFRQVEALGNKYGFSLDTAIKNISEEALNTILYGTNEVLTVYNEYIGVNTTYNLNFEGLIHFINAQQKEKQSKSLKAWSESFMDKKNCPECGGSRLKKEALFFKIGGKNIAELTAMDLIPLQEFLKKLPPKLSEKNRLVASEIIEEMQKRIGFLINVGLDYLSLMRESRSLCGGESQRIRLATQIGSRLVSVLYILDEPSIGLHHRDNNKLIASLKSLRDLGNSIIVVEHDKDMIMSADYVVDIGPGAGKKGGKIVAAGSVNEILEQNSCTAQYLNEKMSIPIPQKRREAKAFIEIKGARGNNLKNIDVRLPLGVMLCVTGVSGSGKSTLINETLQPAISKIFYRSVKKALDFDSLKGLEHIDKIISINQSPIGRTPRSNPSTYTGIFDEIRKLYALLPESKIRNYKAGRFSFNVSGGRCEDCKGAGVKTIEMNFLPDVYVECDSCHGKRYNKETLEIRFKGKSISDVLEMTINHAYDNISQIPAIRNKLKPLQDVGMGYVTLGQSSITLSGGEAQRIKLATELSRKDTGKTVYLLDEPTTALHFDDVRALLDVINRLVDKGNSVIIIEHNMDVIKSADYIIDMGPEGGEKGGEITAVGTPEDILKTKTYTATALAKIIPTKKTSSI
jgi:excinuclease ABC subunit A